MFWKPKTETDEERRIRVRLEREIHRAQKRGSRLDQIELVELRQKLYEHTHPVRTKWKRRLGKVSQLFASPF